MAPAEEFMSARLTVAESMIGMQQQIGLTMGLEFNPATLAKHHAAMTKIQMLARKIVEAAIDAQVECDIARGDG